MNPIKKIWEYFTNYNHSKKLNKSNFGTNKDNRDDQPTNLSYYPAVIGKSQEQYFAICGECYGSYTLDFFSSIFYWFENVLKTTPNRLRVEFWYSYINTSTSRRNLDILTALDKYQELNPTAKLEVFWYYEIEDLDMKEHGEDYQKSVKFINFHVIGLDIAQYEKMTKVFH